jgi:flagellar basal-body rod modification protein FlgD
MEVSAAASASSTTKSGIASAKLAENFDTFLTLLTTQLRNQDPLEPTKSEEFVAQLVRFSQVEQAIASNQSLEKLLDMQVANQTAAAIGYMGHTVEAEGDVAPLQDGKATWNYALGEKATGAIIVISDSAGKVVYSTPGETEPGKHSFVWDGLDASGDPLPEGRYTIAVNAYDSNMDQIEVATSIEGIVTGVASGANGALLSLGPVNVALAGVLAVKQPSEGEN